MPAVASVASIPSAFPTGEDEEANAAATISFENLSMDELLSHGHWKARKTGLEVISSDVRQYEGHLLSALSRLGKEPNATVQEQIFETAVEVVDHGSLSESQLKELAHHLLKLTIEKGITGRPKAAQAATRLLSSLTGQRIHEEVTTALVASFSHKTPKNRQQSLAACAAIIREYGFQSMQPSVVLKAVSPLFSDANALVRKEVQNVFCQCYRYLGAKIQHYFGDLRDVQVEEMKRSFGELEVGVAPEKTIRGFETQGTGAPRPSVHGLVGASAGADDLEMDDETFASFDEQGVLAKLPKNFYSVALDKSLKWQDRCKMIKDHLLPLLSAKKFKSSDDYHELVKCIRELFSDPQAPLMLIAIQCLQLLCKGLRQTMGLYVRPLIGPLFDKMKDKKTSVLEHVYASINTMLKSKCLVLDTLQDEMDLVASSKVPNQRHALITWISGVLDFVDIHQHCGRLIRATSMFSKLVNDDKLEVREAAISLLVKMNGLSGEKLQPLLKQLDSKHLLRVLGTGGNKDEDSMIGRLASSMHAAAAYGDSPSGQSPMKKVARTEKPGPYGGSLVKSLSASTLSTAAQRRQGATSNPNSLSRSTPSSSTANTPGVGGGDDPVALESSMPSKEEAATKLHAALCGGNDNEPLIPVATLELFNSKEWKARYDAVSALAECIRDHWTPEKCSELLDHVVVFLKCSTVWKDTVFQVVNASIVLLLDCTSRATCITQRCAYVVLYAFTPRLTEPKSKALVRELVAVLAEGVTPKFVMKHMMHLVQAGKNPKLTQAVNELFVALLTEFDGTPVDAKAIVDYVKNFCFEQTQPAVKQSAILVMVALRQRVKAKLDPFLADVNPHLRAALDAEFCKPPTSTGDCEEASTIKTRKLKDSVALPTKPVRAHNEESGSAGVSQRSVALAEEDLPRVDLGHHLAALNREMMGGKDWKARSVAIKRTEELLISAHKLVAPNGITETIKTLRSRFDESNKNVVVEALKVISVVLESVEPQAARPGIRHILPAVMGLLSDQKSNLREEAAKVCTSAVSILGLELTMPMLLKPLVNEAPLSRQIAVDILDKQVQRYKPESADAGGSTVPELPRSACLPLVPVLLRLAMDRSSDVRCAAERITAVVGPIVGYDAFTKPLMELKPAEQQQVRGLVERQVARLQVASVPPPAPTLQGAVPFVRSDGIAGIALPSGGGGSGTMEQRVPSLAGLKSHTSMHPLSLSGSGSARPGTASGSHLRVAASSAPLASMAEEQPFTVAEILNGLCNVPADVAFRMCTDFLKRLRKGEDCGSPELAQVMVDLLHEHSTQQNVDLSLGLINCLCAMFSSPRVALRCDCATLVPLLRTVFSCLLSEQFAQCDTVIRALNSMTLKLLEGCQVDEVFGALMSLMAEYSATYLESNSRIDQKFVQVVVKCLMRLDTERVTPNVVIVSCHDYLLQHPPSAFKSCDDLSIRTIKTIMQAVSRKHGGSLLNLAEHLVGSQNLVSHFIKACLENKDRALRLRAEAEQAASAVPSASLPQQQQHEVPPSSALPPPSVSPAPQSVVSARTVSDAHHPPITSHVDPHLHNPPTVPPPSVRPKAGSPTLYSAAGSQQQQPPTPPALGNVVPNVHGASKQDVHTKVVVAPKSTGPIFDKIRIHTTSQEGLDELYGYLKTAKECPDFEFQFNKCSPAFRSFIRRQLEKLVNADTAKPTSFTLPDIVLQTP